jgi:hypothetical protein
LTDAICNFEMTYLGVKRYKGEIFTMGRAMNDEKLVRVGHLTPVTDQFDTATWVTDDSGRRFTTEEARLNYRRSAPNDVIVVRRGRGRPKKDESGGARVPLSPEAQAALEARENG